jgi:hypothetical protein
MVEDVDGEIHRAIAWRSRIWREVRVSEEHFCSVFASILKRIPQYPKASTDD